MSHVHFVLSSVTLLLTYVCDITAEKHLPTYIEPCSKSAADFDECCRKHGQASISTMTKGDKDYDIPPLNPLILPHVEQDINGFKLSMTDLQVQDLESLELKEVKFDLNKNELKVHAHTEKTGLIGKYKCDGQILILPIQGDGDLNVTLTGFDIHYRVIYKLEDKGGEKYIVIPNNGDIKYTMTRAYFHLDNLFGGNEQLGTATLATLNEEWDKFIEFLQPIINEIITRIVENAVVGVFANVPYKNIFSD